MLSQSASHDLYNTVFAWGNGRARQNGRMLPAQHCQCVSRQGCGSSGKNGDEGGGTTGRHGQQSGPRAGVGSGAVNRVKQRQGSGASACLRIVESELGLGQSRGNVCAEFSGWCGCGGAEEAPKLWSIYSCRSVITEQVRFVSHPELEQRERVHSPPRSGGNQATRVPLVCAV